MGTNRWPYAVVMFAVGGILFFAFWMTTHRQQTAFDQPEGVSDLTRYRGWDSFKPASGKSPFAIGSQQKAPAEISGTAESAPGTDLYDLLNSNPDAEQVRKTATHMAVKNFLASPSSKTPEGQAMLRLLQEHGYGVREFQRAYSAAFYVHSLMEYHATLGVPMIKIPVPGGFEAVFKQMTKQFDLRGLPEDLTDQIFEIRPTVPYGFYNGNITNGEPLLTEQVLESDRQ